MKRIQRATYDSNTGGFVPLESVSDAEIKEQLEYYQKLNSQRSELPWIIADFLCVEYDRVLKVLKEMNYKGPWPK